MQPTEIAHFKNRLRQVVARQADRILQSRFASVTDTAQARTPANRPPAADIERIKQIAIELRGAVHESDAPLPSVELGQHALPGLPSIAIPHHFDLAYPALPAYPSYEDFFDESDEQFLRKLFAHLLHRGLDEVGAEHLLTQLRSGTSQLEVLLHIWNSNERKQLGTQLAHLSRAKRLQFLSTLPGIGAHVKQKLKKSISNQKRIHFSATTLQQYEDEGFVRSVYRVILRREPDTHGMRFYMNQLRAGASKLRIIRDMHASREGTEMATVLNDISYSSFVEKLNEIPVIRWLALPLTVNYHVHHLAKLSTLANSTLIANANARAAASDSAFQFVLIAMAERDRIANLQNSIVRDVVSTLKNAIDSTSRTMAESIKRAPWAAYDDRLRKLEEKKDPTFDHDGLLGEIEKLAKSSESIHRNLFDAIEDNRQTNSATARELHANLDSLRQGWPNSVRTEGELSNNPAIPTAQTLTASLSVQSSAEPEGTVASILKFISENNEIRDSELQMLQQSVDLLRTNIEQFSKERRRAVEQPHWLIQGEQLRALDERLCKLEQRSREMRLSTGSDQSSEINQQLNLFKQTLENTLNQITASLASPQSHTAISKKSK